MHQCEARSTTGYYGGSGARMFSTLRGLSTGPQQACAIRSDTGLIDCSNWSMTTTITTTPEWPSGALPRTPRARRQRCRQLRPLRRRDDTQSDILYGVPVTTYEAYNNYGGKSLYDFNSFDNPTVAGTPRAVKVSFDRPYTQSSVGGKNWFQHDYLTIKWLEHWGYDVSYIAGPDLAGARQPELASGVRARRTRRVLVRGHAFDARGWHGQRPLRPLAGSERHLLEGAIRSQSDHVRLGADAGLLQEHPERGPGSIRDPDRAPGATQPVPTTPRTPFSARCTSATTTTSTSRLA